MSALTACRAATFSSSVPDGGSVPAAEVGGALQEGAQASSAGGADGGPRSFQQMMNKAADAPANAGRAGANAQANAQASATAGGTEAGASATPDAPLSVPVAGADAEAAALQAAVTAEQAGTAESALAALVLTGLLPTTVSNAADAPLTDTTHPDGRAKSTSVEGDQPTDDTLATMLSSLALLGFVPQPVATPAPAPAPTATDVAAAPALAVESQAIGDSAAKPGATSLDQLLARMRPAPSTDAAANAVSPEAAASVGTRLDATGGQIVLRDLLDGQGRDAALARDPAESTAAVTRAAESAVTTAAGSADGTRTADTITRTISIPVQHPRWADAVSTEVRWFAEQGVQNATLRLSPEHLGPVEVRLSMTDGQVNVNFSAANADTRTALEQSLPRLRDMLAGAGLSLGEAQVQQQTRQGSQNSFNSSGAPADTDVRDTLARVPMRLGLVDEYA